MSTFTQTILITGGTSGLGYQTALLLAKEQPKSLIVLASRSDQDSSAASINKTLSQQNVLFHPLDLSSPTSIHTFADTWPTHHHPPIHALFLNAGLQILDFTTTPTGIESTFATNHVGHALLFYLLRSSLTRTAKIILTSSGTHDPAQKTGIPEPIYTTAEILAHPTAETAAYSGRQRYSTSKLCNILWAYALQRHVDAAARPEHRWTVLAFDPGLMPGTGLARDAPWILRWLFINVLPRLIPVLRLAAGPNVHTARESAGALAWLASAREGEEGPAYFEGRKRIRSSVVSYDEVKQEDLWSWTARHLARNAAEERDYLEL